jgi:hypothetical protein
MSGQRCARQLNHGEIATHLIHIDPESIDIRAVDTIKEVKELLVPVLLGIWVEPIWEVRWACRAKGSSQHSVWDITMGCVVGRLPAHTTPS